MSARDPIHDLLQHQELLAHLREQSAAERLTASTLTAEQAIQLQRAWADPLAGLLHKQPETDRIAERFQRAVEDMQHQERVLQRALGPIDYARHLSEIAQASLRVAHRRPDPLALIQAHDPLGDTLMRLQAQWAAWDRELLAMEQRWRALEAPQLEVSRQLLRSSVATYETSLDRTVSLLREHDLARRAPALASQALAPTEAFGRYAPGALGRAAAAPNAEAHAVVSASVALAETQVLAAAAEQEDWAADPPTEDADVGVRTEPAPPLLLVPADGVGRIERFFLVQEADVRAHLSSLVGSDGRPLAHVVPTARRATQQQDFGRLVRACNLDARARHPGRLDPFQLSESVYAFSIELGLIDGGSAEGLGTLIDGLFITLYEGTSKTRRLRDYMDHGDWIAVDRVTRLRHLTRHNREREQREVVERQAQALLADLRAMGLDGEPVTTEERLLLHDRLLEDAIAFLHHLLDAIRRS